MTEQQLLAQHTVKIIRAEIEHLPYPGRPIAIGPDNLGALANEYDSAIAFRATVTAALKALRDEYSADTYLSWDTVQAEIDATIAALGLGDQGEERKCS